MRYESFLLLYHNVVVAKIRPPGFSLVRSVPLIGTVSLHPS